MAASMANYVIIIIIIIIAVASLGCVSSSSICPHQTSPLLNTLQSQCPLSYSSNAPIKVDGDFLDRAMTSKQRNVYISVLFYASWCPFSPYARSTFEILSSMFPQIDHLTVEQSSAMPSVFSRYGIHSLPSILMVNQTSRMRYRGRKDLSSLVQFYKETTGLQPVQYLDEDHIFRLESSKKSVMQLWIGSSVKEIMTSEPYLILSLSFICLRVLLLIFPEVTSILKAVWISYVPHLNLEIFGEASQMLSRVLHIINVKRVWTKLRLCKTRNFREGAKNARVWASSLASVSVGETSSGRPS